MNSFDHFLSFIIVNVLAICFAGNAYSLEKPNPKTTDPKNTTQSEQRGTDANPLTVKILPSQETEAKAAREEADRNEKAIQDKKLVDATVALAFVTGILAIFTGGLWYANLKLVRDAKKTAERQAVEMKDSLKVADKTANAAERSAEAAHKTLAVAQRAFVFGKNVNHGVHVMSGKVEVIEQISFWVDVENVGLTPATHVETWMQYETIPRSISTVPTFQKTTHEYESYTALGPRVTYGSASAMIPIGKIMECWNHQIKIFLYARIEYRDIFEPNVIHHHEQCVELEIIRDPSTPPPQNAPDRQRFRYRVCGPQNTTG